ncbi:MAG: hypothetical protein HGA24_00650 [Candidatus Aminicenantes bacterium]|nr:hypothetical protein [Candidatus Aminicenantes bacterium]
MPAKRTIIAGLLFAAATVLAAAQDPPVREAPKPPEPLFVRITAYPTASLSRYDYGNDIDLYEVRVYVELRLGSQQGPAVSDVVITSFGERLEFQKDHFEKRIIVDKDALPRELVVEIAVKGRPVLKETHPLPDWLILTEPRPAVVETGKDLAVLWRFERFAAPVDVIGYDFKTGKEFLRRTNEAGASVAVPAASLPADTIVRLFIIQSWLSKRYLDGDGYARGSEINIIPWSQVFIRTKKPGQEGTP